MIQAAPVVAQRIETDGRHVAVPAHRGFERAARALLLGAQQRISRLSHEFHSIILGARAFDAAESGQGHADREDERNRVARDQIGEGQKSVHGLIPKWY